MIEVLCRYNGEYAITSGESVATLSPDTVGFAIMSYIQTARTYRKDGKPGRSVLFVMDLDLIGVAILSDLQKIGYKDSTPILEFYRQFPAGTYQYTIAAEMGTWYAINVHRQDGFIVSLYSLENVTGQLTAVAMLKNRMSEESPLTCLCRVSMSIVETLTDFCDGKPSLTLASYAMRRWSDETMIFDRNDLYPDCNKLDCDLYGCTVDEYLRPAYKGGWCYCVADKKVYHDGITLDVNSLYPYVMIKHGFPVCKPHFWVGDLPDVWQDRIARGRAMCFLHIGCRFRIKDGFLPFISIPGDFLRRGVLRESVVVGSRGVIDDIVELTLTDMEYKLFQEHYDIWDLSIYDGVCYQTEKGIFDKYVGEYHEMKKTARASGDMIMERVSKMMLNSLSGGFAKKHKRTNILLDKNGMESGYIQTESRAKSLIPIGACITSYARCYIIRVCQANHDRFLYSDTDSAHLLGSEPPHGIDIGGEIGQFKIERRWRRAKFWGQKTYIEEDDKGHWALTYAGVPSDVQKAIENDLDGFSKMVDYFGEIPDSEIDSKVGEKEIPYEIEIPTGTYTPKVEKMMWRVNVSKKQKERERALTRARRRENSAVIG